LETMAPPNCRSNILCTSSTRRVASSHSVLSLNLDWTWTHDNTLVSVSPLAGEKYRGFPWRTLVLQNPFLSLCCMLELFSTVLCFYYPQTLFLRKAP
jgi:hypothetical protein